ncbi:MAG: hypothetical protein F6K62_10845 [Sphaerospermopsis sp. SIO1G2]|nr:hypothetical protein [Sphaerospermopsis sp. SIO1G2]
MEEISRMTEQQPRKPKNEPIGNLITAAAIIYGAQYFEPMMGTEAVWMMPALMLIAGYLGLAGIVQSLQFLHNQIRRYYARNYHTGSKGTSHWATEKQIKAAGLHRMDTEGVFLMLDEWGNAARIKLFLVGTDTAKESIFSRLKITEEGPGYCHFPAHYDEEYFKQLTAEKFVTRFHKGKTRREWIKIRRRNEALDCRVYNLAAYAILNPKMDAVERNLLAKVERQKTSELIEPDTQTKTPPEPTTTKPRTKRKSSTRDHLRRRRRQSNWVHGWK